MFTRSKIAAAFISFLIYCLMFLYHGFVFVHCDLNVVPLLTDKS